MDNYGLVSFRSNGKRITRVALLSDKTARTLIHAWSIQRDRPGEDFYFEPITIENPLACVHSSIAAKKWIGQRIFMWTAGYHPDTSHNEEGILEEFRDGLSDSCDPWFARMDTKVYGSYIAGALYHCQARDPRRPWYIIPEVTLVDSGIAGVFSRIFLGSR